jgi:hypothetical protein
MTTTDGDYVLRDGETLRIPMMARDSAAAFDASAHRPGFRDGASPPGFGRSVGGTVDPLSPSTGFDPEWSQREPVEAVGGPPAKHQGDPAADPERFDIHGHASTARAAWIAKTQNQWRPQARVSQDTETVAERTMADAIAEQRGTRDAAMAADRSQAIRDAAWQAYVARITNAWKAPA